MNRHLDLQEILPIFLFILIGRRCSWIYNYLCNKFLSPLTWWVRIPLITRYTRYNIMWYSLLMTLNYSTNKTDRPTIKLKYYWNELNTLTLFHNPLFLLLTYNKTLLNQHDILVILLVYSIKKGSGLIIMWGWRVTNISIYLRYGSCDVKQNSLNICVFFVLFPLITIWQEYDVEWKSIGNIIWYEYSSLRYYYHWADTSAGGVLVPDHIISPAVNVSLLVPDHIICPTVSVSAMTWLTRYIH